MADSMQNEAMERLKQMYSKAQPVSNTAQNSAGKSQPTPKAVEVEENHSVPVIHSNKSENLIDIFMRDKEKSLIVLLIVLLINEKADTTLILALMYLIL